jgi:predicted nucleic acid-binding protein
MIVVANAGPLIGLLNKTGTIGTLIAAKKRGLVAEVTPLLELV